MKATPPPVRLFPAPPATPGLTAPENGATAMSNEDWLARFAVGFCEDPKIGNQVYGGGSALISTRYAGGRTVFNR